MLFESVSLDVLHAIHLSHAGVCNARLLSSLLSTSTCTSPPASTSAPAVFWYAACMLYAIARLLAMDVSSLRILYLSHSNVTPSKAITTSEKSAEAVEVMCLLRR